MRSVYAVAVGVVLFAAALTFVVLRGEDTRDRVKVVERTVDPCKRPKSDACQRRIRLVLRELVRRHPGEFGGLSKRESAPKVSESPPGSETFGGGGAGESPSGGGPIGRVPSPGSPPESENPEPPGTDSPDPPLVDLDAPLVPKVCVGDLVGVNC